MNKMPFKDFNEFKELFEIKTNAKGEQYRSNKILLAYYKHAPIRRWILGQAEENPEMGKLLEIRSMTDLWNHWDALIRNFSMRKCPYCLDIMGSHYGSQKYSSDGQQGLCLDGDYRSYRYVNNERNREYKMKIGKLYKSIILGTEPGALLPEQVVLWMCEEMARKWEAFAASKVCGYTLHVDDNFEDIYSRQACKGNFHSCMVGGDHWTFYKNCVNAKAAYLTEDDSGLIVARCIIFQEVTKESTGEVLRLAERQYSTDCDLLLQNLLVRKLIDGGYIDGHKKTGADCGAMHSFVTNSGESLSGELLSIEIHDLDPEDTIVSYQDSFKAYSYADDKAYNDYSESYDYDLATTDNYLEERENYDDYYEDYTTSDVTSAMWNGREINISEDYHPDFVWVESADMYYHEDDACFCEDTDDYRVKDDCYYSDILGKWYSDEYVMQDKEEEYKKENWYYCSWNEDYVEDKEDCIPVLALDEHGSLCCETMAVDTYNEYLRAGCIITVGDRNIWWSDFKGCGFDTLLAFA